MNTVPAPGVTLDANCPAGWNRVVDRKLLIIVGLTGAGKSTGMTALRETGQRFSLLPNRRALTDSAIIALYDDAPVHDRLRRFELTRRFAQAHPGGMAGIVERLSVDASAFPHPLVFDGLRGAEEVTYAATSLPHARFLVVTAPDFVRLIRLVLRTDGFDRVATPAPDADAALPGMDLLTPSECFQLEGWMRLGALERAEVREKLSIVAAEHRNYDAALAIAALMAAAPERTLVADTSAVPPRLVGMMAKHLLAS